MLEFQNVSFKYKEDDDILFEQLSFQIQSHEFVSIIGASGCGKSTIFRLINGLEAMQAGAVFWYGTPLAEVDQLFSAYMPQNDLLLPWRSTVKNVELPLELRGIPAPERRRRALDLLQTVGLTDYAEVMPSELSGGMRQRVSFARTLMTGAEMLLLDEPFSALDFLTRIQLQSWLIQQYMEQPRTILFVTHDVEEALFLSSRVLVMEGRPVRSISSLQVPLSYPRRRSDLERPEIVALKRTLLAKLGTASTQQKGQVEE
ncbi:MAG TPA: ABC transporter ATP-binding protein [Clostridiaceae bacterium]|nr:ABC transporter ATP-binding protein [Clostridiaceae bacterium]